MTLLHSRAILADCALTFVISKQNRIFFYLKITILQRFCKHMTYLDPFACAHFKSWILAEPKKKITFKKYVHNISFLWQSGVCWECLALKMQEENNWATPVGCSAPLHEYTVPLNYFAFNCKKLPKWQKWLEQPVW